MLTYLASPYSHSDPTVVESRFRAACVAAAQLMREGKTVFSPIAHSHPIAIYGELPLVDLEFWLKQDRAILVGADELVVLMIDGWKFSKGVAQEIEWAAELGIPVTYMESVNG